MFKAIYTMMVAKSPPTCQPVTLKDTLKLNLKLMRTTPSPRMNPMRKNQTAKMTLRRSETNTKY